jgi:uncharacterized protein YqgC (DUF456 family)
MRPDQLQQIQHLISMSGGAAIGALIARFLLNSGAGGMLLGAMLGGFMGHEMSSRNVHSATGLSLGNANADGNPYHF